MRIIFFIFFLSTSMIQGQNNKIRGKVVFMNSGKKPAIGVEVFGVTNILEKANRVYTSGKGEFELIFPKNRDGHEVEISIGKEDVNGKLIELVNDNDVEKINFPANTNNVLKVIVCKKGERDALAQQYYRIIKASSTKVLINSRKELNGLLQESPIDKKRINELTSYISRIRKQQDSVKIYKEAYILASKNKDDTKRRTRKYLTKLEEGSSVQEALKELNIEKASSELGENFDRTIASIEELEYCAKGNVLIFRYDIAIKCYNIIINELDNRKKFSNPSNLASYYEKASLLYYDMGDYNEALKYQEKVLEIRREYLNSKHRNMAISFNNIGDTYRALGKYQEALEFQQRAMNIFEEILEPNDIDLVTSYNDTALAYFAIKEYEEALKLQKKVINIQKEIFGSDHRDLASSLDGIGLIYLKLEQNEEGLSFIKESFLMRERLLSPKHLDLASSYSNLASAYFNLKQYKKALEYQKKGISIQNEYLGLWHPDLATSYSSMGGIYNSLKRYDESLEYHQRAINIREELFESNHPLLIASYDNIALSYYNFGKYEKALKYQKKSMRIIEEISEPDQSMNLSTSYKRIAMIYSRLGNYTKAIEYQQKVIDIYNSRFPKNHPERKGALNLLLAIQYLRGIDLFKNKNYLSALKDFNNININLEKSDVWNYTGLCYYNLSNYEKSIEAYSKVAQISPKNKGHHFYNNIGMAYCKNGQYKEAKEAFVKYEKLFSNEGRPYRNWAMFYTMQNDKEKAIINLKKAIDLGYSDLNWILTDNSMNNLKSTKEFQLILKSLERNKK